MYKKTRGMEPESSAAANFHWFCCEGWAKTLPEHGLSDDTTSVNCGRRLAVWCSSVSAWMVIVRDGEASRRRFWREPGWGGCIWDRRDAKEKMARRNADLIVDLSQSEKDRWQRIAWRRELCAVWQDAEDRGNKRRDASWAVGKAVEA